MRTEFQQGREGWATGRHLPRAVVLVLGLAGLFWLAAGLAAEARQAWMTWNARSGLPGNDLTCMAVRNGQIAVGTPQGIAVFHVDRPRWIRLSDYGEEFGALVVRNLDYDPDGNLWAATPNGLAFLDLAGFPAKPPRLELFGTDRGLSTIDVETVQVVDRTLYAGCFGGWLFQSQIGMGVPPVFQQVQDFGEETSGDRKFMDVGISALAMDFPTGGIFATKGRGLVNARDSQAYALQDPLPSDWVDDFWAFQEGGQDRVIALTQNQLTLVQDRRVLATVRLPDPDAAVSCLTTAPDEETNVLYTGEAPEQTQLRTFLGKRILYVGTKGQGLWQCDEGVWSRLTTADSPLPSDTINRVYYLPGARRVAVLTDGGLCLFGTEEVDASDEFKFFGVGPLWARNFIPFMSRWGPRIMGYPDKHAYPIEPSISYHRIARGRDLWIAHDKGISRFTYPQAFFLGALQLPYRLAGRFENPLHDPRQNLQMEDNSSAGGKPPGEAGERIWHHYCLEQPNDVATVDLTTVYTTLDRKTLVGPLNQLLIDGPSPGTLTAEVRQQLEAASGTLSYPPVPVFRDGDRRQDIRGHDLFSIDSLSPQCPLHPLPGLPVTDLAIDAGERCWAIIDGKALACLDEPASVVPDSSSRFDPSGNHWHTLTAGQVPWPSGAVLRCVRRVGVDLYVGTQKDGLFILPRAHLLPAADLTTEPWVTVAPSGTPDDPHQAVGVIDCTPWRRAGGTVVALLHREGLSVYDGGKIVPVAVPKRVYTVLCEDRTGTLWLGSLSGLLRITSAGRVEQIVGREVGLNSDRITAIAAAPDDAKYPFLIALACDETARERQGIIETTVRKAHVAGSAANPYVIRFIDPSVTDSQLVLFDGKKWDPFVYAGIRDIHFDEMYLWTTDSWRVKRYFIPTLTQVH
ncbi:MAG: hypothetical protein GX442_22645 [Candidatus Riflebacteria bacterium]|nr:hypothetical protein [Candidatus Riflebacteria bacterium]